MKDPMEKPRKDPSEVAEGPQSSPRGRMKTALRWLNLLVSMKYIHRALSTSQPLCFCIIGVWFGPCVATGQFRSFCQNFTIILPHLYVLVWVMRKVQIWTNYLGGRHIVHSSIDLTYKPLSHNYPLFNNICIYSFPVSESVCQCMCLSVSQHIFVYRFVGFVYESFLQVNSSYGHFKVSHCMNLGQYVFV